MRENTTLRVKVEHLDGQVKELKNQLANAAALAHSQKLAALAECQKEHTKETMAAMKEGWKMGKDP